MRSLQDASQAVRAGTITPVDLVEECLSTIDRLEDQVRAWVFVDRDGARETAKLRTEELKRGQYRGPLHGIPLGVKDIFDIFDWPTAAGSKRWAQSYARTDAPVVKSLRQAGAIFLGKTVTTQYASFDPPVTRNPWKLDHTPGGSSSGSAAALAVGMCLGALGSQTGGSICRPASFCGVCGIKPTYGLLPVDGILPLAPSLDHPGPMARTVGDLALLLGVMVGSTHPYAKFPLPSFVSASLRCTAPPKLGRLRGLFQDLAEPSVVRGFDDNCKRFTQDKAIVTEVGLPAGFSEVIARHRTIMAVEAAAYHETRYRKYPEDYGPAITQLLNEGLSTPATVMAEAKDLQDQLKRDVLACFEGVDVLICPATTSPAPDARTTGNPAFNSPWSFTGLPSVSLPTGQFVDGLPLAIQVIGKPFAEAATLAAAAWCEKTLAAGAMTPPNV